VGLDLMATDFKYSFACEVEIIPEDKMNNKYCELYRKLKNLECELVWMGKIWKKGFFRPISDELQTYIPQLKPSFGLVETLHANADIMKLINKLKPEELILKLYSGIDITKSMNDLFKLQVNFYHNPTKIAWIIRLTEGRYITSTNPYKLTAEICLLLNLIAKELKDLTHRLE